MSDKDLITTDESTEILPAIADDSLIAIAEQAEKRVDAMNKIKHMALRLTNHNDWVNENDRPYLQGSGGEKVARLFGISWRIYEPQREDLDGGHFIYSYQGEFSLAGASIDAIGSRSSKDGFFKRYDRERKELPPSEIDPGDVKKAAYTNLLGNGITRLLGIRNLTWEDLEKYAGIKKDQVKSVQYKRTEKAGATEKKDQNKTETNGPDAPATEAQCRAIHAILKDRFHMTDEFAKHEKVSKMLEMQKIITSMGALMKGQASNVIDALNKELEAEQ